MKQQELFTYREKLLDLMSTLGSSGYTIKQYASAISAFIRFLENEKYDGVLDNNCVNEFSDWLIEEDRSSSYVSCFRRIARRFVFFINNGYLPVVVPKNFHYITGGLAELMNAFIAERCANFKEKTVNNYRRRLYKFNEYYKQCGREIDSKMINDYFLEIKAQSNGDISMYIIMNILKNFFGYLHERKGFDDFSKAILRIKYPSENELSSTFTTKEINAIISNIDRNSDIGKRAYAIIILAVRYGLRCCDIVNLKFVNINWVENKITIVQSKTGKTLELPLLPEVGNAILDYLKNVRRESDLPFVFLTIKGPDRKLSESGFYTLLQTYVKKAKIPNLDKRHHGPHSLRHSLAGRLLENGVKLETISAVLGHSDSQVTTRYLSIDFKNLKRCVLKMPKLTSPLYKEV